LSVVEELAATKKTAKQAAEIKALRQRAERAEEALLEARQSRVRIPTGKPQRPSKGSFKRVIVPDSHGASIDPEACKAFLSDLEVIGPSEIVMLGDHLDCGGWLAKHHTLGFVSDTGYCYEDDVSACNQFLDEIQRRAPKAKTWYIEGNHEQRVAKGIIDQTLGHKQDAEFLMRCYGHRFLLHLEKRGIEWVDRGERYGLQRPGCIRLGKCIFTHGKACGVNAARTTLSQFGANVCFGHTHRIAVATKESADEPTLAAWSFGCLCKRMPLYYDTNPTDWAHGYGLQIVSPSGRFFTIQVPIIDGRSLLQELELRA
jgi:predicted phosphodiesterase